MTSDAELLRRYAESRSEIAFAELVQRYLPLVYGAALRRIGGDSHRAMDVAQEVFMSLARHAASLSRHASLTGWLYAATRNATINTQLAEQRRKTREHEAQAVHEFSVPAANTDWEQVRPVIDDAMDQLDSADREAVLLRFFAGRPFAEIGVALRMSDEAARKRVDRALDRLRRLLERRGLTSTSAALATALGQEAAMAAPAGMASTITHAVMTAAASGVGGTAGAGFLSLLGSPFAAGIAGLMAALALVVAGFDYKRSRDSQDALAVATQTRAHTLARVHDLERRAQAEEQAADLLRTTIEETQAKAAAAQAAEPAKKASAPFDPAVAGKEFMARHPEARELLAEDQKAVWAIKFAPLFASLGLRPEQIDRVGQLMLQGMPLNSRLSTPSGSFQVIAEPIKTMSKAEVMTEARAILQDGGFERLRDYERGALAFELITQVAGTVFRSAPLSREQGDQVAQILANASPRYREGRNFDRTNVDWGSVIAQSQPLLSPLQLSALVNLQKLEEYRKAAADLLRAADSAAARDTNASRPDSK